MVSLSEGARICRDGQNDEDVVVGGSALKTEFHWTLCDAEETVLAEWVDRSGGLASRWSPSLVIAEPYQASYPDKLRLRVETRFALDDGPTRSSKSLFEIPRIQDETGPLVPSHGDEEGYAPFRWKLKGRAAEGLLSTHDCMVTPEGQKVVRSPFHAIVDDGRFVENPEDPPAMRGCLTVAWENLFDNSNEPFWGTRAEAITRFAVVMRMRWELPNSHYLVGADDEPYFAVNRMEIAHPDGKRETVAMVDLSDTLKAFDQRRQPFGRGVVRIPLPYDRTGRIELGFHAADGTWPRPNVTTKWIGSFRVEDDIAPVLLVSLMETRLRQGKAVFDTIDAVNRRWVKTPAPWTLPSELPAPSEKAEALSLKEDSPIECHVFAFDNTRLERRALTLKIRSRGSVPVGSFGFRPSKAERRLETEIVLGRSDFDPSVARTAPRDPPMLLFQEPGPYELVLEGRDVNGNLRTLVLPLQVEHLEVDVVTVEERGRRR